MASTKPHKGDLLFLSGNLLSRPSADIVYIMEMCNAFSKAGYNTTLCTPKLEQSREELFGYYRVEHPFELLEINLPRPVLKGTLPGRALLHSIMAALKVFMRKGTLMYTREPWFFFLLARICGKPCVFEAHQFRFGRVRTHIYHHLVRQGMRSGRGKAICISHVLMKQWQEAGIEAESMAVAHDAVNLEKFDSALSQEEARRKLSLDLDAPVVGYTGSLLPGKGVEVLAKASNRLENVLFLIVGGAKEDIARLRRLCQGDNVLFTGQVPPDQVPWYQAAADVLALPNVRGSDIDDVTSPMKLFEYLASGRPIVASNMPSLLEILTHEGNALISPAGDDFRLAADIKLLLDNKLLADRLVKNARRDLEKYSWDARIKFIGGIIDAAMHFNNG